MKPVTLYPLDMQYHKSDCFREQLAVLYYDGIYDDMDYGPHIKVMRSFISVGSAGASGFSDDYQSADAWVKADNMIENERVCGVFHTHPVGFDTFSSQDWRTMIAFAKTYGKRYLWYGVQPLDGQSQWVCLNMIDHKVFKYHFGTLKVHILDKVLLLPIPPKIKISDGCFDVTVE